MPQDRLEDFIIQHRENFDDAIPSLKVWADIDSQLTKQKSSGRRKIWMYLRVAASVMFLLMTGGVVGNYLSTDHKEVAALNPELQEMEDFYSQQFQKKYAKLTSMPHDAAIEQLFAFFGIFTPKSVHTCISIEPFFGKCDGRCLSFRSIMDPRFGKFDGRHASFNLFTVNLNQNP